MALVIKNYIDHSDIEGELIALQTEYNVKVDPDIVVNEAIDSQDYLSVINEMLDGLGEDEWEALDSQDIPSAIAALAALINDVN